MVQSLFCLDFGLGSFYFWPNQYFLCLGLLRGSSKFRVQSFTKTLKFGKFKFWSCQLQSSEFLGSKLVLTNRVRLNTSQNSIVIFIFPIFVVYNRILKFFEVISFDATGGIIQLYMNFLVEGQVKKCPVLLSSSKIYQSIFHNLALFISNFINALLNKYLQFYLKIINIHSLKLLVQILLIYLILYVKSQ